MKREGWTLTIWIGTSSRLKDERADWTAVSTFGRLVGAGGRLVTTGAIGCNDWGQAASKCGFLLWQDAKATGRLTRGIVEDLRSGAVGPSIE